MDKNSQFNSDCERLAELISRYTGISSKRVYDFVVENGADKIQSYMTSIAKTDAQRAKLNTLFEFKSLYDILKGADKRIGHVMNNLNIEPPAMLGRTE